MAAEAARKADRWSRPPGPALTREEREFLLRPFPAETQAPEEVPAAPPSVSLAPLISGTGPDRLAQLFRGLGGLVMHRLIQKLV